MAEAIARMPDALAREVDAMRSLLAGVESRIDAAKEVERREALRPLGELLFSSRSRHEEDSPQP